MLIRLDRIGDVLLTLPMADAIKSHYPEADVDLLVQNRVYELVSDYPNINKVHSIEKVTSKSVKHVCKQGGYDAAIIVSPSFAAAKGVYSAGIKFRIGTAYRWYSFFFNVKHYRHRKHSVKHESEYNLDLLEELNIFNIKNLSLNIKVKDEYVNSASDKLKNTGIDIDKRFIVIHIPTLSSAKVWSNKNFTELIKLILNNVNNCYNVLLTGTSEDIGQVKEVMEKLPQNDRVFGLFNLSINELAAVISKSVLFLGNSTGPIHIAAAVGTFTVGLYSPVTAESERRWGPLTDKKKIFAPQNDDNTRDVMDDISPAEVYNFINNFMENHK